MFTATGVLDSIEQLLREEENLTGNRVVLGESDENKRYGDLLARYLSTLKDMRSVSRLISVLFLIY